jgi:hypothetical protein
MVAADAKNSDVVRPVLNGEEVNSTALQEASRSVVCFRDFPLPVAKAYREPFEYAAAHIQPERQKYASKPGSANKRLAERWWLFGRYSTEMYRGIASLSHCWAAAINTKHLAFSAFPTDHVFTNTAFVIVSDAFAHLSVLQSTMHEAWARKHSGSLGTTLRYSPSDCFETYPFPEGLWQTPSAGLSDIGSRYHEYRRRLMLSLWLGLTDVYNLFHSREMDMDLAKHFASRAKKDPAGSSIPEEHRAGAVAFTLDAARARIVELRRLHVELDVAVRDAYGWHDLPLEHDFYEVETLPENDRVRYTISPAARKELLKRLLAENHRRAAAESAAQTQTPPSAKKPSSRGRRKAALDATKDHSTGLFPE